MTLTNIGSPDLIYKQIQSIEEQLKHQTQPGDQEELFAELDSARQSLQLLQATVLPHEEISEWMQAQLASYLKDLSNLQDKIITLFGDIYTKCMDDEVERIKALAEELQLSIASGDLSEIRADFDILTDLIQKFCKQHRPSRSNRKVIADARKSLKLAGAKMDHLILLQKTPCEECDGLEQEMIALFEIADCVYHSQFKSAKQQFAMLSSFVQKKVIDHLKNVGTLDLQADVYKAIQALIVTAHEISNSDDGEGYLSREEIDELFHEVDLVKI